MPLNKLISEEKLLLDALQSVQQKKKRMLTQRAGSKRRANAPSALPTLNYLSKSAGGFPSATSAGMSGTSFPQLGQQGSAAATASRGRMANANRAATASMGNPGGGDLRGAVRKLDSFMTKQGIRTMDLLRWCAERPPTTRSEGPFMCYITNSVTASSDAFNTSKLSEYLKGQVKTGAMSMSSTEIKLICRAAARNRKGQIDFKSFTKMLSAKYASRPQSGQRTNRESLAPYQRHNETNDGFGSPIVRPVRYSGARLTSRQTNLFDTSRIPPTYRSSDRPISAM
jgi:hypothetical protein